MSDSALKETWKVLITNDGIASRSGALGGGMTGAFLFAMFHSLFDSAGATVAGVLIIINWSSLINWESICSLCCRKVSKVVIQSIKTNN